MHPETHVSGIFLRRVDLLQPTVPMLETPEDAIECCMDQAREVECSSIPLKPRRELAADPISALPAPRRDIVAKLGHDLLSALRIPPEPRGTGSLLVQDTDVQI